MTPRCRTARGAVGFIAVGALLVGLFAACSARISPRSPVAPAAGAKSAAGRGVLATPSPRATLVPLPTAAAATHAVVPPDSAASGRWWMEARRSGGPGAPLELGFWRRDTAAQPWEWRALEPEHLSERVVTPPALPLPPPAPSEMGVVWVERVVRPTGEVLGYWVWNAAQFVELPSGSHSWRPEWQWAAPDRPFLLLGDGAARESGDRV